MSRPVNCSAAWPVNAARYRASPPLATSSGTAHAITPIEKVIALPRSAPAPPRPVRSSSTTPSSGSVSQIVCVRAPTARPAMSAPTTISRPDSAIAAGCAASAIRRRTNGRRKARLRDQCHAQARHVAQRAERSEPEERRGDDDNRREHDTAIACQRIRGTIQGFDASKQRHEGKHRQRAEHRSPHRQRAGLGRPNRMRQFAEGDKDRISRRVRLMFRRIEVAHAKRKVHRVEVFERRRQKGQVRDQKHRGESGGPKARGRGFHKGVFKTHRIRRRAPPVFAVLS